MIRHIFISGGHDFFGRFGEEPGLSPVTEVDSVECVAGRGIRGDRFFDYKPDFKGQITFFEWETYEALWRSFPMVLRDPGASRRNVVTVGMDLNALIGEEFEVGGVRFWGSEESSPCAWMDRVIAQGAREFLAGRGGLRARILKDGVLRTERGCGFGAALMCGGKSRRMGVDKATMDWNGQPMWKRQVGLLELVAPAPICVLSPSRPAWCDASHGWVGDVEGVEGPLGGLLAGLQAADAAGLSHLIVLAVDLPEFGLGLLRTLRAFAGTGDGVIPRTEKGFEPLAAIYPVGARAVVEAAVAERRWKLQDCAERLVASGLCQAWDVPAEQLGSFRNLNSPGD